ncbi:YfiR family protein [Marinobacterium sp. D7]|uniref:YfiR family protein n=1 Tax=Marinobacterium ramblicola TaxID=2849041 RepID=UPI001C2DC589|nr:YfiR family protein [Marinobacterium ramblicola]MBV1786669.1 YfiR family protein [Marinobacterium ramblicola]
MRAVQILLTLLVLQGSIANADHDDAKSLADQVKAAFIFKFCSYVEWPRELFSSPDSPIVIGTLERDASMARLLKETVRDRQVGKRPVEIRILPDETDQVTGVHVLYLGGKSRQIHDQITALRGKPVLIVTDQAQGLEIGSSINFRREDERIRFDISLTSAQTNRLKISSRLLAVARRIEGAAP